MFGISYGGAKVASTVVATRGPLENDWSLISSQTEVHLKVGGVALFLSGDECDELIAILKEAREHVRLAETANA